MSRFGPDQRAAALGEGVRVGGFALAGALVFPTETPTEVRAAWHQLPADVGFVVLTASAAEVLAGALADPPPGRSELLTVVLP